MLDITPSAGMLTNIEATLVIDRRRWLQEDAFVEIVVWEVPSAVPGSAHTYKYRAALVVKQVCVLRYDNERGKGDHIHSGELERPYAFWSLERLLDDFMVDAERWLHAHPD
ncbi:MAG: toxin-antitoxin system TumE family protein, partial [Acetobacteraceae bacterium]